MMKLRHCLPLVALLFVVSCASKGPPELRGADFYFEEGENDFKRHRYLQAVESFQRIVSNFPGHARVAEAQYYLAESYYGMEEYVNAAFEYERVVDTYPSSVWRDDAQYKIGESYFEQSRRAELDQRETYEALTAYRRFIEDNPGSPLVVNARERIAEGRARLAKKQFLAGRLYQNQGHQAAARMTYEQMLNTYPETPWYWQGLAQLGFIARNEGKIDEARGRWQEVLQSADSAKVDVDLLKEVREWLAELDAE
jgi:outer membrane protein assembly factor BamD